MLQIIFEMHEAMFILKFPQMNLVKIMYQFISTHFPKLKIFMFTSTFLVFLNDPCVGSELYLMQHVKLQIFYDQYYSL